MIPIKAGSERQVVPAAWAFTISFILITFLPRSLDDTMFMDGVTYASISRNMSMGIGSFWKPFFAHSFWLPYDNAEYFYGHPPLMFGIQSLLFRLLGDHTFVENIYNLLVLISTVSLIVGIWCKIWKNSSETARYSWLPVLCWYGMVGVWYAVPNNFLDSTMAVFCLLSCYFQLLFVENFQNRRKCFLYIFLAGVAVVMALLTKGPVGLYPLAFTFFYFLSPGKTPFGKVVTGTSIMVATIVIVFLCILLNTDAREFLFRYFDGQVVQALLQKREKAGTGLAAHFTLLYELLRNLYPHLAALTGVYVAAVLFRIPLKTDAYTMKICLCFFLVAISGIVPMLISVKQYPHYLLPALPFVAMFFAALLAEKLRALLNIQPRLTLIAFMVAILGCWGATAKKLADIQEDVNVTSARKLRKYVPARATIGICHDLFQHADIHANLQRYHFLSLTTDLPKSPYVFADSSCLDLFDRSKDSVISLSGPYLLVIKNQGK